MEDTIILVLVSVPSVCLVIWLRAALGRGLARIGHRVGARESVARRLPYHNRQLNFVALAFVLAVFMPAIGWKAEPGTSAHTWRILLAFSAAFVALGLALLGTWWLRAGSKADEVDRNGGVTFEPARPTEPPTVDPGPAAPAERAAGLGWGAGAVLALVAIPFVPVWISPVAAVAGGFFGYRSLAALGLARPGRQHRDD